MVIFRFFSIKREIKILMQNYDKKKSNVGEMMAIVMNRCATIGRESCK